MIYLCLDTLDKCICCQHSPIGNAVRNDYLSLSKMPKTAAPLPVIEA